MEKMRQMITGKSHRRVKIGVLIVIIFVISISLYKTSHKANAVTSTRKGSAEQVDVASVASLSPTNAPLSVIGQVTSLDQATILSQATGEIVTLDKHIGDQVASGEIIATIENTSQQAAVLQAQGIYDAANAALIKASGGIEGDSSAGAISESQGVVYTQASLATSLQNAYVALDDAVHTKADALFNYPRSTNPTLLQFFAPITNQYIVKIQNERLLLESVLANDYSLTQANTSAALEANVNTMASDAQTIEMFLDDIVTALNLVQTANESIVNPVPSSTTLAAYQTSIASARSEVTAAITNLTGNLNTNDTASEEAQVEQALGALNAAKSALSKTIITSPISGTIISLPITEGDYVSSGNEVAEVSNPNALKIVTHVSPVDARTLSVGGTVTLNGTSIGTITQISPAIDPGTGTIEVDVTIDGSQTELTDGDSVTIGLDRTPSSIATANASSTTPIIIPIVALKITPTGPEVFTVDAKKNVLVPNAVQIGSILGQDIVVVQGLTPDMMIVTDARGLTTGESVTVKKS